MKTSCSNSRPGGVFRWTALAAVLGLLFAGCQSFSSNPGGSLASVTIANRTMPQIATATEAVFASKSFTGGPTGPNQFSFERPGSRMNDLAYGSLVFKEKVTVRVVVTMQPLYDNQILLSCKAWLVEDDGDPVFQDKHRVRPLQKWPYQELLRDIQDKLK
jgi:hypothetical protein